MRKIWQDEAWEEYLEWQTKDKKTLKKINDLIKDFDLSGFLAGLGDIFKILGDMGEEAGGGAAGGDLGGLLGGLVTQ